VSFVYNCCWPSSAQSFWGSSPTGLMTIFYSLRFDTPPTWKATSPYLYSQEQGGPVTPPDTGFPFRRLLRLAALRWKYLTPPPRRDEPKLKSQRQSCFTTGGLSPVLVMDRTANVSTIIVCPLVAGEITC
jgi:hypothetical protein